MRRRHLFAAGVAACALLSAGAASAQTYDRLVVFGDSLSDNGNLFALSRGTEPRSPPYFNGRFSSGPVFTELLGFNLNRFGTVAGSTDYAFGGARTDLSSFPPGIRLQLQSYLAAGGRFGPNDLVSVYGGANNIFQGINALPSAGAAANANPVGYITGITNAAAADLGLVFNGVAGAGAGTLLIPNLPSLGATPQFNGFVPLPSPLAGPLAEIATGTFNTALLAQVNAAAGANAGANFIYMDVNRFDDFVRSNPAAFGFTNTTTPCLNLTTGVACANPDQFLYFDTVHPTAAGHRGLAALALDYIYYGSRGAGTAAMGETSLLHREAAQDAALELLSRDAHGPGPRFSVALEGGSDTNGARGPVPEIERETGALSIAVDAPLTPDLVMGLSVHAAQSSVEAGPHSFETDSLGLDVYAGFERDGLFVNAVVGGSSDEYGEYRRATGVGPVIHFADRVTGSSFGGKVQAGYRFALGAGELSPRAALSAIRTTVEAFNENGPAARHAVREQDVEALGAEAAIRFDTPLGARFRGHLEAGYGELFDYDSEVATALVDNPARPLGTEIEAPGRGALLGAGLRGELAEGVQLGVGYRGRFGDDHDSHAAMLTVTYRR